MLKICKYTKYVNFPAAEEEHCRSQQLLSIRLIFRGKSAHENRREGAPKIAAEQLEDL